MRLAVGLVLVPLAFCLSCVGCRKDESESTGPSTGVVRCVKGLEKATLAATPKEGSSIYYEECADMFSDVSCRDSFRAAARLEPEAQLGAVAGACKKAYCPALGAFAFAICKDDFKSTPESLARDWPPLFDAIVAREAGMSASEVSADLLKFYVASASKAMASAAAAAAASAAPVPSGAAPVPSGSAAPTPSAAPPAGSATKPAGSASAPAGAAPHPSAH